MKLLLVTVAVAALGAAAPALAQEAASSDVSYSGMYGNLGWAQTDTNDAKTQGVEGRVGGRFGRFLGVEGELKAGLSSGHQTYDFGAGPTRTGVKQSFAGAAYAVGFLPITHKFDLLARVGYGASRYQVDPTGGSNFHFTENGIRWGGGAEYFFDGRNGIRADWTREHAGSISGFPAAFVPPTHNADVISVAFAHRF